MGRTPVRKRDTQPEDGQTTATATTTTTTSTPGNVKRKTFYELIHKKGHTLTNTHIQTHSERQTDRESEPQKEPFWRTKQPVAYFSTNLPKCGSSGFYFFCVALAKKWGKGRGNWVRGPAQVVCQNYMLKHQHEGSFPVLSVFFCSCLSFPSAHTHFGLFCAKDL